MYYFHFHFSMLKHIPGMSVLITAAHIQYKIKLSSFILFYSVHAPSLHDVEFSCNKRKLRDCKPLMKVD